MLVETGLNTGTFIATGNACGTTTAVRNGNVNIQGWYFNNTNAYGTASYTGADTYPWARLQQVMHTLSLGVLEASASGRIGLL